MLITATTASKHYAEHYDLATFNADNISITKIYGSNMIGLGCIHRVKLLFGVYLIKIEFYLVRTDKLPNDILVDFLEIHYKNRGLHPNHIESINRLILVSISDISFDKKGTFVLNTLLNFGHTQSKIDEFAFFFFILCLFSNVTWFILLLADAHTYHH